LLKQFTNNGFNKKNAKKEVQKKEKTTLKKGQKWGCLSKFLIFVIKLCQTKTFLCGHKLKLKTDLKMTLQKRG
jgi:hypothetical protein